MNLKLNIRQEIDDYIEYLDLKEITKKSYKVILGILADYFEQNKIDEPTRSDLLNFKEAMLKKVGSASVQKYIVVIRGFFRHLKVKGTYDDISYQIRGLKVENTFKRQPLTLEASIKLMNKAKRKTKTEIGKRDYAIIVLLLTTGLRGIEINRANVEDIDYIGDEFVLHIQGKGRDTKTEYVKLSTDVYEAIQEYLVVINQNNIIKEGKYTPLFLTKAKDGRQNRLSTKGIRTIVKDLLVSIGYDSKAYSAHSLRHTFATLALTQGATILQTQEALRHKNISTTQIYAHMVDELKGNINEQVSNALFNKKKGKKGNK